MSSVPSIRSIPEFENLILQRDGPFLEVWAEIPPKSLVALINAERGWLTLFRYENDAGIVTVDPTCESDADIPFRLSNGQVDHHPEYLCVSLEALKSAFAYFFETGDADPSLDWTEEP